MQLVERTPQSAKSYLFGHVPRPEMTVEQARFQLLFHAKGSRFQRRRIKALPRQLDDVRPAILAKLELIERIRRAEQRNAELEQDPG